MCPSRASFALLALLGCGAPDAAEDETDTPVDTDAAAPTAADVEAIFTAECVACHQGQFADGELDLTLGVSAIVDVASVQVGALVRVAPGSRDGSYLWHKLQGTAGEVGGTASQMPFDGSAPLTEDQLDTIGRWIDAGAPTE